MSEPVDVASLAATILAGMLAQPIEDSPLKYLPGGMTDRDALVHEACSLARQIIAETRSDIPAGDVPYLEVGTEWSFVIRVRGTVTDRSADEAEGRAYELQLAQREFSSGRTIAIEHDEIIAIDHPVSG